MTEVGVLLWVLAIMGLGVLFGGVVGAPAGGATTLSAPALVWAFSAR